MRSDVLASITVSAQPEHLHALRELTRNWSLRQGFCEACVADLVLAVNEACMNVIQHGYQGRHGEINLEIMALPEGIEFRISDTAPRVDMSAWQPRDLKDIRPGGLGVHFIREIMDEVAYLARETATGNCLSLKKQRSKCRTQS